MAITTRTLSNTDAPITNGVTPIANAIVTFRLCDLYGKPINVTDTISGETIISTATKVYTNAAGIFTVDLWPNDRTNIACYYSCNIKTSTGTKVESFIGFLPDGVPNYTFINFKDLDNVSTTQNHNHSNKEVIDNISISNDNLPLWNGGTWPGSGSGHVIQEEGSTLTTRSKLNFVGANVTVTDDSGNDRTVVTVDAISSTNHSSINHAGLTGVIPVAHTHAGTTNGIKLSQANTHESPDTDSTTTALHHTLGTGANQAAAGDHGHIGLQYPCVLVADYDAIADGSSHTLTAEGYTLGAAQAKWPNAGITSVNQQVDWAAMAEAIYQAKTARLPLILPSGTLFLHNNHADDKALTIDSDFTMRGLGKDISRITGNFNGTWFDLVGENLYIIEDFCCYPQVRQSSSQIAFHIRVTSQPNTRRVMQSRLQGIVFEHPTIESDPDYVNIGHYVAIKVGWHSHLTIMDCISRGHEYAGIWYYNQYDSDKGDFSIVGCNFTDPEYYSTAHIYCTTQAAFKAVNCKFLHGNVCIYSNVPSDVVGAANSLIQVANCSAEGYVASFLKCRDAKVGGRFEHINITGCEFLSVVVTAGKAIDLDNCGVLTITGNTFRALYTTTGMTGIYLRDVQSFTIVGNVFYSLDVGIDYGTDCTDGVISSNQFTTVGTEYSGTSASVTIIDSSGGATPAGTVAGQLQLRNSDGTALDAVTGLYYDSTLQRMWFDDDGTGSGDVPSVILRNSNGNANQVAATLGVQMYSSAAGSTPQISYSRFRGTLASRAAVQANDYMGVFAWFGWGASAAVNAFQLRVLADENFSNTDSKATMSFSMYEDGATAEDVLQLTWDGSTPTVKIPAGAQLMFPDNTTMTTATLGSTGLTPSAKTAAFTAESGYHYLGTITSADAAITLNIASVGDLFTITNLPTSSKNFTWTTASDRIGDSVPTPVLPGESVTLVYSSGDGGKWQRVETTSAEGIKAKLALESDTPLTLATTTNTTKILTIKNTSDTVTAGITGAGEISGVTGTFASPAVASILTLNQVIDTTASPACITAQVCNGTLAAPTPIASTDRLFQIQLKGCTANDTYESINRAIVRVVASETWSSTAGGFETYFYSRANGNLAGGGGVTQGIRLTQGGSVVVGAEAALATNVTDGFLYIPTCAGVPNGTPTAVTGKVALIFDTTNSDLYVYNGAWKRFIEG